MMSQKITIYMAGLLVLVVSAFTVVSGASGTEENKKVASDGAVMQTEDLQMSTRVPVSEGVIDNAEETVKNRVKEITNERPGRGNRKE